MDIIMGLSGAEFWIFPLVVIGIGIFFGLFPGLILRAVVQLYPRDHPRREELFGELYRAGMGRVERFEFVFQQFETALREGPPMRKRARVEQAESEASEELDESTSSDPPQTLVQALEQAQKDADAAREAEIADRLTSRPYLPLTDIIDAGGENIDETGFDIEPPAVPRSTRDNLGW